MYKFLNKGVSVVGVPDRNLTVEEFKAFELWLQQIIKNSGAYEFVELVETVNRPNAATNAEKR